MNHDEQLKKLLLKLNETAIKYSQLFDILIVFKSDSFIRQKIYKARFYKENFLHLTGVITNLTAIKFFEECYSGNIREENILNFPNQYRTKISRKLINLSYIDTYFDNELDIQEDFTRNSISCALATSDGYKTLGFTYTDPIIRPMTILNTNKLDKTKPIYTVKPMIVHLK